MPIMKPPFIRLTPPGKEPLIVNPGVPVLLLEQ
jgi:hypothetical protein